MAVQTSPFLALKTFFYPLVEKVLNSKLATYVHFLARMYVYQDILKLLDVTLLYIIQQLVILQSRLVARHERC